MGHRLAISAAHWIRGLNQFTVYPTSIKSRLQDTIYTSGQARNGFSPSIENPVFDAEFKYQRQAQSGLPIQKKKRQAQGVVAIQPFLKAIKKEKKRRAISKKKERNNKEKKDQLHGKEPPPKKPKKKKEKILIIDNYLKG